MNAPVIRLATDADAAALAPLLVAQLHEHEIPAREPAVLSQVREMIAHPDQGFVLLAEQDGTARGVAYVSFARPLEHEGEVAWLEELYVVPAHRGAGIGGALLDEVCARADARGCVSVDLEVDEDHVRATHLYQRAGFRSLRRTQYTRQLRAWDWGA